MLDDSFDVSNDILKKLSALQLQRAVLPSKANDTHNMATETVPFRRTLPGEPNGGRQRASRTLDSSYSSSSSARSSLSSSLTSVYEDHDFTRVKSTITSDLRYKIARNEPVKSHYYREHIKTFGKPPFVLGTRGARTPASNGGGGSSSSTKSSVSSSRIV